MVAAGLTVKLLVPLVLPAAEPYGDTCAARSLSECWALLCSSLSILVLHMLSSLILPVDLLHGGGHCAPCSGQMLHWLERHSLIPASPACSTSAWRCLWRQIAVLVLALSATLCTCCVDPLHYACSVCLQSSRMDMDVLRS